MSHNTTYLSLNLRLFDGEGGTLGEGETGVSAGVPDLQNKNPLANISYGKQEEATATAATVPAATQEQAETADLESEFEEAIKGKYKDLFKAKVQDTVQRRLKSTQETVAKYNAIAPVIESLAKRYGVDPTDFDAISKAVDDDTSYYETEAMERGVSVEQLQLEHKYQALQAREDARKAQERTNQIMQGWMEQAEEVKQIYPSFDMETELGNKQFVDLLSSNIDVRTAYEVVHKDEIIGGAMQYAVQQTKTKIANKIRSGSARPVENGARSQSPSVVKSDVSQLSKEDRAEIMRRVAAGERIRF